MPPSIIPTVKRRCVSFDLLNDPIRTNSRIDDVEPSEFSDIASRLIHLRNHAKKYD
jgi:hypothetical protein